MLVIAQACWELQTTWAINGSTLSCREFLKSNICRSPGNNIWDQIFKKICNKQWSIVSTNNNVKLQLIQYILQKSFENNRDHMEILKFKNNTWYITSCYSASATAIESYWGGGGGYGQNGWWDKKIFIESRLIYNIKPLYNKVRHLNVSEKTIDQIQESGFLLYARLYCIF